MLGMRRFALVTMLLVLPVWSHPRGRRLLDTSPSPDNGEPKRTIFPLEGRTNQPSDPNAPNCSSNEECIAIALAKWRANQVYDDDDIDYTVKILIKRPNPQTLSKGDGKPKEMEEIIPQYHEKVTAP